MISFRYSAAFLEVVAITVTGVAEEVEAVWPVQMSRYCERMLLLQMGSWLRGSRDMVKALVQGVIDGTLQVKCCCAVFLDNLVDSVVWRTDCLMLVVQADPPSVAQAESPPASVCTDPM